MNTVKLANGALIILIILAGCNASKEEFTITGHIDGIGDSTLITLFDQNKQLIIDSAFSMNGDFVLKGKVDHPTRCYIFCNNEYASILVENLEMTYASPIQDMYLNHTAHAGKEQALNNKLANLQKPFDIVYFRALDSLRNEKFSDENEKKRLIERYNKFQAASHEVFVNFGKTHADSYLGIDIVYRNRSRISYDSLKIIYKTLSQTIKETPEAKGLKVYLYDELAEEGQPFIDFTAHDLSGENFTLSSLKGNYIYLSFWSAGCRPCRMENRFLTRNFIKIPKELSVVSFSIDKNSDTWKTSSKADSILWHNVSDLEGEKGRVKTQYGVQAIPTSFLIDRKGIIIKKFYGFDPEEDIIEKLRNIIEKKG